MSIYPPYGDDSMNDSQLHQQIGKLTEAVTHINDSVNLLGNRMTDLSEKVSNIVRKLDNRVQKDTVRMMGFDYTQPEEHRKDPEWLRSQRRKSDSWRPVIWNIVKAVLTAAAIAICTYVWQATFQQVQKDVKVEIHKEQSK